MLPDAIAHDTTRTGLRREATFAAVYSAVEKLAAALGPLAFGLVLEAASHDREADAIRMAVALVPAAASALSAIVLLGYGLDRELRGGVAASGRASRS
jgi:Na+/melibiose symporter-like transporter